MIRHFSLDTGDDPDLPRSPAAERNADPILAQLRRLLPASGRVLEIASGTGQHAVHFAAALSGIEWQPSDADPDALKAVGTRVQRAGLTNLRPPVKLDVEAREWPLAHADAIVCVNLLHISPWSATEGLLAGAGRCLPAGGILAVYGPFRFAGEHIAESNARFDADLRSRDPSWGVRDVADVAATAGDHGLDHEDTIALPANNHLLVFRRRESGNKVQPLRTQAGFARSTAMDTGAGIPPRNAGIARRRLMVQMSRARAPGKAGLHTRSGLRRHRLYGRRPVLRGPRRGIPVQAFPRAMPALPGGDRWSRRGAVGAPGKAGLILPGIPASQPRVRRVRPSARTPVPAPPRRPPDPR